MHNKCFLCNSPLDDTNRSKEHIIKNSIGGRKKTNKFICNKCNKDTGKNWDYEIDEQFGDNFSRLLNIKRQRGKIPKKIVQDTISKKKYIWENGKLKLQQPSHFFNSKEGTYTLEAPNKKRVKTSLA